MTASNRFPARPRRRPRRAPHCAWRAVLLVAAFLPLAGLAQGQVDCAVGGQDCALMLKQHVVKTRVYWEPSLAKPLEQRIGPASAELIDFMTQDNIRQSIPNRPRPATVAPEFLRDVQQAVAELPGAVKRRLEGKLAGIHFAEDFGGSGWTDAIADADGSENVGFIVLDSAILSRQTANAWATWKENTPFKPQPGFELVAQIEDKSENNRKNAIQYIVLHELGHVLSIGEKIHPPWTIEPKEVQTTSDLPYFSLSWTVAKDDNRFATVFDRNFALRTDIVYYFGAKLAAAQMLDVYNTLETTNFPSLYAATHPGDDWAEAFVTYVHTVMMNKPFEIRIYREGALAKTFRSCWTEKRCAEKRKILEHFIERK